VAQNLWENTHFSTERGKNHELGTGFLCIRESYQQLRGLSMLVLHNSTKRSLVLYHCSERNAPTEHKTDDVKTASTRNWNVSLINSINTI
jgi:hypothetical protein